MINIMYAADDNYASILAVSILSLCKYNQELNIVVIDNGISSNNKKIIEDIVIKANSKIMFVMSKNIEEMFPFSLNMDRGSIAQFSRLFIGDIVPREWEKVLYLDCDTLIMKSLDDLYNFDLDGNVLGGVEDAFSKLHWKKLGLHKNSCNINSGVMLIDLEQWKKQEIEGKLISYIITKKGKILQGDQGIINAVLNGMIKKIPLKYNMVTYHYDFTFEEMMRYRRPYKYYSEKETENAKAEVVIIHFTSSFASMRPWEQIDIRHPYAELWNKYYEQLGFTRKNVNKKLSCKLYKMLPHNTLLNCISIVHCYLKPILKG